ncbi:peptidase family S24 [Roseibium sp. TrichSKD4]|uniref:S24 family peptidase n=1 Tax=Roseibium sp. TrichSKD4 TaxID=744980 RepID=UPI0001E566B3|nr:helix-turn-helix transcriptional regulator [Roseibium sp. TrichSKD4]EFO34302.1 peptidase family S24 [Roseibium sp. TrichSKD4]
MLSHKQIWAAIDTLAARNGLSPSGLARRAGLDPTTFNPSKRFGGDGRPRWPSTESLSKILQATGESLETLMEVLLGLAPTGPRAAPLAQDGRMVPIAGFSDANQQAAFDPTGRPSSPMWDSLLFPDPKEKNLFALEINSDDLTPYYRSGDILIVAPVQAIRRGDRVLVRQTSGALQLFLMDRQNPSAFDFHALTPPHETVHLERTKIDWVARVMWVSQ